MSRLTESIVEDAAISWFEELGYAYLPGPDISPGGDALTPTPNPSPGGRGASVERADYGAVVLEDRLYDALVAINPGIPPESIKEALRTIVRTDSPNLILNNRNFHKMVTEGVDASFRRDDRTVTEKVWLFDFDDPENNDWLVVNQFTVVENHVNRRPDMVVFVNGLPLGVIELKNAADESADVFSAYNQLQTYKAQIPSLFTHNEVLLISDGADARVGSLSADFERFLPWRTIDGDNMAPSGMPMLETAIRGVFEPRILLDLIRHFSVFEDDGGTIIKKLAAYHQYYAVNKAVECTIKALKTAPSPGASRHPLPEGEGSLNGTSTFGRGGGEGSNQIGGEGRHYRGGFEFAGLKKRARELRQKQTPAEEMFWELVRNRQFMDLKFRRQHQIGDYIPDFCCPAEMMVVEFDGAVHDDPQQKKHDQKRDRYLESVGFNVLRFENKQLLDHPESVFQTIQNNLPSTSGRGAGGEGSSAGEGDTESSGGDGRIGVVWHTQGSGKSLSMLFFAGKIIQALDNPTLVVITDRNDLDDQLFGTFALGEELLRQSPVQAESRGHLRDLLQVASGGVVFTTVQKFAPILEESKFPLLSDRRNIVVIADEAHRSQYDLIDGFARHLRDGLPNASFIGFTGTPIELEDRNTRAIFGDHISVYDIEQAVEDGATVKIYYEARLAKIDLVEAEIPHVDPEFDELTEAEETSEQSRLKRKWSRLEAMVGTKRRLALVAKDIVEHFEKRQEIIEGKAMIVCMSRRICVDLFDELIKLRPDWDDPDFGKGAVKVVMTGSASDPEHYARHLMTKTVRKDIEHRFKDAADPLKIVLVRDMWLTGFDVPCLHTMYVDKPMQGHGLMQAIARVNRVFMDKPGGLIVDYLGIAEQLKKAVSNYTTSGGKGSPTYDQGEAVEIMLEKYEIICDMLHGFDWIPYFEGTPGERLTCLTEAVDFVLALEKGSEKMRGYVRQLAQAFALAGTHEEAMAIRDDVGFFQAVRAQLIKLDPSGGGGKAQRASVNEAIKQLVSRSVSSDEVIDVFTAAGLDRPDISILDDAFLDEFSRMPQKNLALEMLRKLLKDEIRTRARTNLIQSKQFSEMLEETIRKYQNRTIDAAEVILELVNLAKEFREAMDRGEELGLTNDEIAFYDALEVNDSAVMELGDDTLKKIAHELVESVRRSVTIDWTAKESVKAKIRVMVKRILRKHGYPPDKQEQATRTVLRQAELLCGDWAEQNAP